MEIIAFISFLFYIQTVLKKIIHEELARRVSKAAGESGRRGQLVRTVVVNNG